MNGFMKNKWLSFGKSLKKLKHELKMDTFYEFNQDNMYGNLLML